MIWLAAVIVGIAAFLALLAWRDHRDRRRGRATGISRSAVREAERDARAIDGGHGIGASDITWTAKSRRKER